MEDRPIYSREETARLRRSALEGAPLSCPRCGKRLQAQRIPAQRGVSYVRRRVWWTCPGCGRGAVLDEPRSAPGKEGSSASEAESGVGEQESGVGREEASGVGRGASETGAGEAAAGPSREVGGDPPEGDPDARAQAE